MGLLLGMFAGLILTPFVMLAKIICAPFDKGANLTATDVAAYITSVLNETRDDWRWEDFEQMRIRNPRLEEIRRKAVDVKFPLYPSAKEKLKDLLFEVEHLSASQEI